MKQPKVKFRLTAHEVHQLHWLLDEISLQDSFALYWRQRLSNSLGRELCSATASGNAFSGTMPLDKAKGLLAFYEKEKDFFIKRAEQRNDEAGKERCELDYDPIIFQLKEGIKLCKKEK